MTTITEEQSVRLDQRLSSFPVLSHSSFFLFSLTLIFFPFPVLSPLSLVLSLFSYPHLFSFLRSLSLILPPCFVLVTLSFLLSPFSPTHPSFFLCSVTLFFSPFFVLSPSSFLLSLFAYSHDLIFPLFSVLSPLSFLLCSITLIFFPLFVLPRGLHSVVDPRNRNPKRDKHGLIHSRSAGASATHTATCTATAALLWPNAELSEMKGKMVTIQSLKVRVFRWVCPSVSLSAYNVFNGSDAYKDIGDKRTTIMTMTDCEKTSI